jgi:hypothetical protein
MVQWVGLFSLLSPLHPSSTEVVFEEEKKSFNVKKNCFKKIKKDKKHISGWSKVPFVRCSKRIWFEERAF